MRRRLLIKRVYLHRILRLEEKTDAMVYQEKKKFCERAILYILLVERHVMTGSPRLDGNSIFSPSL